MESAPFSNPLPGVPHVESPFFSSLFSPADGEIFKAAMQLREQGFAVIDFPEHNFDVLADRLVNNLTPHFDKDNWNAFKAGSNNSLRLQDAWKFDEDVKAIACNAYIIDLLTRLYGAKAWPFQTLNFPVGTQQAVHTDSVHFSSQPERFMCGVWVALEDITIDNGPLMYYPGSHRWPIYSNQQMNKCSSTMERLPDQSLYEGMWSALLKESALEPEYFFAKKGQALIWAANLMHGGALQVNRNATRWSQVTHYFFENCAYYTPMHSDPFLGEIDFRDLVNIATGEAMPQQYAEHLIPDAFINAAKPRRGYWASETVEFEPNAYLAANPDVAKAGVNPYEHYMRFGRIENRKLKL